MENAHGRRRGDGVGVRHSGSPGGDRFLRIYGRQMAPMAAVLADETAINNVIAYIDSLPDKPSPATISGDVEHGAELFVTCAYCHGAAAQGIWSMNAPRAAGMDDWYLAGQLRNFKDGVRGGHPQDSYGEQMAFMARTLVEDSAIDDVVAYINTLRDSD